MIFRWCSLTVRDIRLVGTGKALMLVTGYKIQWEGRILSRVFRDSFTEALASDLLEACKGQKAVIKEDVTE